jgi:glyoxylase-like metal-dependent hydrolase (beta-lactamase superfamily II)
MTQSFAFGGEEGVENFDSKIKYRSSLQNYLIDTDEEIILVDTGMPKETPEIPKNDDAPLYMGEKIMDYVSAFEKLGYNKEDVTKILITHKHDDHTGEIRNFPNAKVYISKTEAEEMNLVGENIIPVEFNDGPYHNFQNSEKITENLYLIEAKGHTTGNSIVILEDGQKYYMFQGDVTYTDEALYENKLSVVFEDLKLARETLDNVREFVSNNPTIYLSTHTPLGYENLENQSIIDSNNPPESIEP